MIKKSLIRGINSFMYSVGSYLILQIVATLIASPVRGNEEFIPMLPEFAARFANPYMAVYVQMFLIALTSAVFGAGSIIMELERLSLLAQSVLYLIVTMAVWVPVGCVCWGLHKYPEAMVIVGLSYMIGYSISWAVQYCQCRRNIKQINDKLEQIRGEEYELRNRNK